MSSFLYLAGRRAVKARKMVVLVWVSVLAVLGGLVFFNMGSLDNSVEIPGTESGDALEQLAATFPQVAGASAQIVVTGPGVVDEGASAQAINNATDALTALPDVDTVTPLVDEYTPAEISSDDTSALITIQLTAAQANVPDEVKDELHEVTAALNAEIDLLLAAYAQSDAAWCIVSNEVGLGIVPAYPLGRLYRDALGRANQRLAAAADCVLLMVAGLPMTVK